jgi:hypothetical protein
MMLDLCGFVGLVQPAAFLSGLDISCGCFGLQHFSRISIGTLSFVGVMFLLSAGRTAYCCIRKNR